jgi:hypothetical protein
MVPMMMYEGKSFASWKIHSPFPPLQSGVRSKTSAASHFIRKNCVHFPRLQQALCFMSRGISTPDVVEVT